MAGEKGGQPNPTVGGADEDRRQARMFGKYAGAGLQFAVSVLLFLYVGQWVDRRFGWAPWGMIVGVFVGAGAAFYSLYSRLMADLRAEEARKRQRP